MAYQEIEHTADVAIRVRAPSLAELFCQAAEGMFALIADLATVRIDTQREVAVDGPDDETLLVNWLNELLYQAETSGKIFCKFEVDLRSPNQLQGLARGGPAREVRKHIKAVTFHDLRIERTNDDFETTIVFDV